MLSYLNRLSHLESSTAPIHLTLSDLKRSNLRCMIFQAIIPKGKRRQIFYRAPIGCCVWRCPMRFDLSSLRSSLTLNFNSINE